MGFIKYNILTLAFARFFLAKLLTPILVAVAFFSSGIFFSFFPLEKSLYTTPSLGFTLSFWLAATLTIFSTKPLSFSIFSANKVITKHFSEMLLKAYTITVLLLISRFFLKFKFRPSFLLPRLPFLIMPFVYIFAIQILINIILIK